MKKNYFLIISVLLLISCSTGSEKHSTGVRYAKAAARIIEGNYQQADSLLISAIKEYAQMNPYGSLPDKEFRKAVDYHSQLTSIKTLSEYGLSVDTLKEHLTAKLLAENKSSQSSLTPSTEYKWFFNRAYLPAIIVLAVIIAALYFYLRKERFYTSERTKNTLRQDTMNKEIDQLTNTIHHNENEIKQLNKQIQRIQETKTEMLGKGKDIFERVKDGATMKNISIEDEQSFVDYYALTYPDDYTRLMSPYFPLSLRHTTFLILQEMGFTATDIQRILFVKDSTIRNYRLRISKKKKQA